MGRHVPQYVGEREYWLRDHLPECTFGQCYCDSPTEWAYASMVNKVLNNPRFYQKFRNTVWSLIREDAEALIVEILREMEAQRDEQ